MKKKNRVVKTWEQIYRQKHPLLAKNSEVQINVLGFYSNEEKKWNVVALEMDIWGYGETLQEAYDDLAELVLMQISFAVYKGMPDMIWHRADPVPIYQNLKFPQI